MVQKRPFDDGEQYEIPSKFPKQLKHTDQQPLFSEINPSEDGPDVVDTTGESGLKVNDELPPKLSGHNPVSSPVGCEEDTDYSEDEVILKEPFHIPFFPEYFYPERGVRTLTRHEDIYSCQLQLPPQKPVPIGSNYQADIPPWNPDAAKKSASDFCSTSGVVTDSEVKEMTGSSVIPMPNSESLQDGVGAGRSECWCHDKGSLRCARQHVDEAREKIRRTVGTEAFEDLGFLDMGEQVAEKWAEEEEHLFHDIVFSNPPSIGRNFWNILSSAFPSRTKREIVSYYFNVFMLRRRAEQNRFDPSNADSDNDEWRLSDDEDEDSVVESPERHVGLDDRLEHDVNEYDEDAADETYDDNENFASDTADKGYEGPREDHMTSKFADKAWDERRDENHQDAQDAQDDSCTSFDNGAAAPASSGNQWKDESRDRWASGYTGMSNNSSVHDYGLEPCDAKLWDVGYMSHSKREVDFLPTCSMIEEVFGDGSWNDDGSWNCKMDGKGPPF